jgi:hypothetical protein
LEIFVEMVLPILNTSTKEFAEAKKQSVLVFGFLGLTLHFPDDSQSQHKESYNKRSKGALFVLEGIGGREFFTLGSSTLGFGTYANDNLTNSLVWSVLSFRLVMTSSVDAPAL